MFTNFVLLHNFVGLVVVIVTFTAIWVELHRGLTSHDFCFVFSAVINCLCIVLIGDYCQIVG